MNLGCCLVAKSCPTLCDPVNCSTPGFPALHYVPEYAQTHLHWVDDAIQLSHPLSSPSPPALNFPSIRLFSNESVLCVSWPMYWSFTCSISPSNDYSGMISLRIDRFDLLAVQGTLKRLLQYHTSKAPVLRCSACFLVQLSHPHMTTGKTIALTIWNCFSKVMTLIFNMLSKIFIAFLPRSKCILISWLQSLVYSDFGAQENNICPCFNFSPFYLPWSYETRCPDIIFLVV